MCQAGANCFLLNLAYVNSNDMIMQLSKYRDEIEKEFECYIPIICLLKGTLVRISMMSQPNIFLRKGQQYRLILNEKIIGDEHVCGVDDKEYADKVKVGDKLLIDYGYVSLIVKGFETSNESLDYLRTHHNYDNFNMV